MRQPKGIVAPACSAAKRIGCSPSLTASRSLDAQADRPARAALAVADVVVGLEALDVQPRGVAVAAPARGHRLEQPGRSAQERLALGPVGAQLVQAPRGHTTVL